jgi:hypothetical protein
MEQSKELPDFVLIRDPEGIDAVLFGESSSPNPQTVQTKMNLGHKSSKLVAKLNDQQVAVDLGMAVVSLGIPMIDGAFCVVESPNEATEKEVISAYALRNFSVFSLSHGYQEGIQKLCKQFASDVKPYGVVLSHSKISFSVEVSEDSFLDEVAIVTVLSGVSREGHFVYILPVIAKLGPTSVAEQKPK